MNKYMTRHIAIFILLIFWSFMPMLSAADESGARFVLRIDLQEGFSGEAVTITVDGKPVLDETNVVTKPSIDLAAQATVKVARGKHTIQLIVDGRNVASKGITVHKDTYVGVRLFGNLTARFTISHEPFYYD